MTQQLTTLKKGGSFLIEDSIPEDVFTPEDFSEEHTMIRDMTEQFVEDEVLPQQEKIEHKEWDVTVSLLRRAGELGLLGIEVPEKYGGENLLGGAADLDLLGSEVLALRGLDQVERVDVDVLLFGEAQCRPCRRADRIVGHRFGRAGDFEFDVGLLHRQPAHPSGQAARGAERLDRHVFRKILGRQ